MFARQLAIASLLSIALLSLLASVLPAASGPFEYCKADDDAQARKAFIDKIAAPVLNKMFECGLIP